MSGSDPDAEDAAPEDESGTEDGTRTGTDATVGDDSETPVEVGDNREKHVAVVDRSGERTEHVQAYLRHTTDEFVVSADDSFPVAETTRYAKADLLRVEIAQQHSTCFITTATVGEGETLELLRTFRDDVLRRSATGRTLVSIYYRVSPPVAYTLSRHPTARTTRLVRWLVERSATLERRRNDTASRPYATALVLALTLVYVFGVCCALVGHAGIRLRESLDGRGTVGANV